MTASSKETAEHYIWGGKCDGWHLAKSKNLSIIQERVPPGCAELRHYHKYAEQFFYVLSGMATLEVDDAIYQLSANQGLYIAANTPHQLSNNQQQEDLEFLVVSTPPSHGDRVEV